MLIAVLENILIAAFSSELYCFGIQLFLEYLVWQINSFWAFFTIILYQKRIEVLETSLIDAFSSEL